mgnify:CR=1 FL=1
MSGYDNRQQQLQAYFTALLHRHYGNEKTIQLPFFGGFLTLSVKFDNGMIDLISATSSLMGDTRRCDAFSIGYTDPVGLARSAAAALKSLAADAMSYEAKAIHDAMPFHSDSV